MKTKHFAGRHVVITGGASGFGLGCAKRFAALGANITIADINHIQGESSAQQISAIAGRADACQYQALDLSNIASIGRFAERLSHGPAVDLLLNNAGIYPPSQRQQNAHGQELTFAIAYLGHFYLTYALWPRLLAAEQARVISVTSIVQKKANLDPHDLSLAHDYLPIRAYQQAKLACLMFALELNRRCQANKLPVHSLAVHPGICRSKLGANRPVRPDDNPWQKFMTLLQSYGLQYFGQSPSTAANAVITAAQATQTATPFFGPTGPFEAFGRVGPCQPGPAAANHELCAELWLQTESILGISFLS